MDIDDIDINNVDIDKRHDINLNENGMCTNIRARI